MNLAIRKIFLCAAVLFASFVQADDYCEQFCAPDCCRDTYGQFSIGGDWLYWKVEQQKMQVGAAVHAESNQTSTTITSQILTPHFQTKSGYRIFADWITCDTLWKVEAAYTHMPSNASFNHNQNPAKNITFDFVSLFNTNFPLLTAIAGDSFANVRSKWNVDISYFDFDLSRTLSLCDCLEIRPHVGVRGQWIHQKFRIDGVDTLVFSSTMKGRLRGIGLEGGLWGAWNIGCGVSLIGHFGGALVYAQSRNKGQLVGTDGTTATIRYKNNSHISLPAMDAFIGLAYTPCYFNALQLHVGWEEHVIFNTNQFSVAGGGDMTLQGLTLGGSITF